MDAVVTRMLTFCVSVCYKHGCSGFTEVNILRIRMLQRWMQWLHGCSHFAFPYATKMDAVVTRRLTLCVSVCYKNGCTGYTDVNSLRIRMLQDGCSGYTDVNILRIRMLQDGCSGYTDVNICVSVCYKDGCSGYTDVHILRIRMLRRWMQWLHGY